MYKVLVFSNSQFSDFYYNKFKDKFFSEVTVLIAKDVDIATVDFSEYQAVLYQIDYPLLIDVFKICNLIRSKFEGIFILVDYHSYVNHKLICTNLKVDWYYPLIDGMAGLIKQTRYCLVSKFLLTEDYIEYKDLKLNLNERVCYRAGIRIPLRNKEFELLKFFMENPNRVFSRTFLLESIWDINAIIPTNTVDTHISLLRKKIDFGFEEKRLITVQNIGYKLS